MKRKFDFSIAFILGLKAHLWHCVPLCYMLFFVKMILLGNGIDHNNVSKVP